MNQEKQASDRVRWRTLVMALAVAQLVVIGSVPLPAALAAGSDDEAYSDADADTEEEATVTTSTPNARQRRKAQLKANRYARRQEHRAATQSRGAAAGGQVSGAAAGAPVPAGPPVDLKVAFKLDTRLTRSLHMGDRWATGSAYTGTVGQDTVEAKATGVDARGVPTRVTPRWIPADPDMVKVMPGAGGGVTIAIQRPGESRVRVAIEDAESKEVVVARELLIKASQQGIALQLQIDASEAPVKGPAWKGGGAPAGNGWRYVDDGQPPRTPVLKNGWKFVD